MGDLRARQHPNPEAQVRWNLTNHTPDRAAIVEIERLRSWAKALGEQIIESCPESRERSLALTHLEETCMWAVASIARAEREMDVADEPEQAADAAEEGETAQAQEEADRD